MEAAKIAQSLWLTLEGWTWEQLSMAAEAALAAAAAAERKVTGGGQDFWMVAW